MNEMQGYRENFFPRQYMRSEYFEYHHYYNDQPLDVSFHHHSFHEIFVLLSGNVEYQIEDKLYRLNVGDILIINSNLPHRPFIRTGESYERIVIWVGDQFFESLGSCGKGLQDCILEAGRTGRYLFRASVETLTSMFQICTTLEKAKHGESKYGEAMCFSLLMSFLVELNCAYEKALSVDSEKIIRENEAISRVIQYINDHYAEKISLELLAEQAYVSKFYMCKKFKEFTNMTINQYITKKRLEEAYRMLEAKIPVTTVFENSGFGDYSNFLKSFKREYGCKPSEINNGRRENRKI